MKEELSQYYEDFDALETDHIQALAAVQEEKRTVCSYIEKLRNSEVQIVQLQECVATGSGEALCGYSQAKSYSPIFDKYA